MPALTHDCGNRLPPRPCSNPGGSRLDAESPRKRGLYFIPLHGRAWAPASTRIGGGASTPQSAPQVVFRERRTRGSTGAAASSAVGRPIDQAGAPRSRIDRPLLEARDTRDMQLRIVDRSAFLFDTAGTVAAVRVHHRLIPLAITYVLPR
jgi:hypothetical protein